MCLMEILEDKHAKSFTIISSQLPMKNLYNVIGKATINIVILKNLYSYHTEMNSMGKV